MSEQSARKTKTEITVTAASNQTVVNKHHGGPDRWDIFRVGRPGHASHSVAVRVSWDSGTPQEEKCDCRGFRFRRKCEHIDAVYTSKLLIVRWD